MFKRNFIYRFVIQESIYKHGYIPINICLSLYIPVNVTICNIMKNKTSSVNGGKSRQSCNISRMENGHASGFRFISLVRDTCFPIFSFSCCGFMTSFFLATGTCYFTSCQHSPSITWSSWIHPTKREIIALCIPSAENRKRHLKWRLHRFVYIGQVVTIFPN